MPSAYAGPMVIFENSESTVWCQTKESQLSAYVWHQFQENNVKEFVAMVIGNSRHKSCVE